MGKKLNKKNIITGSVAVSLAAMMLLQEDLSGLKFLKYM